MERELMETDPLFLLLLGFAVVCFAAPCSWLLSVFWWFPRRLAHSAHSQGLRGPQPHFLFGNARQITRLRATVPDSLPSFRHDLVVQHLVPDNVAWSRIYGKTHLIWIGPLPHIVVGDMDILKESLSFKHNLSLGKSPLLKAALKHLIGNGIVMADGDSWVHERRTIMPAFHQQKIKSFVRTMVSISQAMAEEWCQAIEDANGMVEIDVEKSMKKITADIIAHTQFGSSYKKGKKVFQHMEETKELVYRYGFVLMIPGITHIPTPGFIKLRRLSNIIEMSVREIIQERKDAVQAGQGTYGDDLLGLMLSENERISDDEHHSKLPMQQLIDECKTFFIGGHEATSLTLTWTLLLLAHNKSWQDKARDEVMSICKDELPDYDSIGKMKIVEMILFESLRLYPPVSSIWRIALNDMKVGGLFVPKGMGFWIPIASIHMDPDLWGDDVYEFNPERFIGGVNKAAKHPCAYMPFSYGPRDCLGQSFGLMEGKLVLATILLRFYMMPSSSYKHSPEMTLVLRPKYGAPIILKKLERPLRP